MKLSARAALLKPSPTLGITAKANQMRAAGEDVVSFAAGEPDFNTPEPICRAAIEALEAGFTKYTPSSGIPSLREEIADKLRRENGLTTKPENVVVSVGAKHSVYNTFQVLLDPGDQVILPAPYWMTYADQILLAEGRPVPVFTRAEDGFVPDPDAIEAAVTPKTKAILINSPSNPTGGVISPEGLRRIAEIAERHDLWIVSDEIYERLVYGVEQRSIAGLAPEVERRTVTVNGFSKTFSMTGWRIGYCAAPAEVAKAMGSLQDQVTSNPTSFGQKGAIAALSLPPDEVERMRAEFEGRRELIVGRLNAISGVKIEPPKGAFYAFADFSAHLGDRFATDQELAAYLLETAKVAAIPGSVFEGPGYLRLSYAASRHDIERGVQRIADALHA